VPAARAIIITKVLFFFLERKKERKKEESSFLKKRSKRLLFLCANLTVRFRSEACFQVVSLMSRGEQLH
jgi:hypothetical protein